jgi:hypothetical protein
MANDFSSDTNCVALWRFEDGALTADSKGSNTLSPSGSPVADTGDFKEGAASCDFEAGDPDYFTIADASLDSGYPLKSGESNKDISVTCWIKIESLTANRAVYSKYENGKAQFAFYVASDGTLYLGIGYNNGVSVSWVSYGSTLTTGIWYHIGVTWEDSNQNTRIRVWDDNAGSLLDADSYDNHASVSTINIEDAILSIGRFRPGSDLPFDGLLDEIVVFNDVLTAGEIDEIRAGTYGAAAADNALLIGSDF